MKKYNVIVTADDFRSVLHEEVLSEDAIKQRVTELAPDCNIDWTKIFTDKRCLYFQHYMPSNKTTTQHSYKENNRLYKSGNLVKVYISERWHEENLKSIYETNNCNKG